MPARNRADRGSPPALSTAAPGGLLRHRVSPRHAAGGAGCCPSRGATRARESSATVSTALLRLPDGGAAAAWTPRAPGHGSSSRILAVARAWPRCADGRSIDTSMGFTPAAGLVMGTRIRGPRSRTRLLPGAHRAHDARAVPADGERRVRAAGRLGDQLRHARPARARGPTRGRPRRSDCSATRRRNGSARTPRRWAASTRWSSPAASAKTPPRPRADLRGPGFLGIEMVGRQQCEECAGDLGAPGAREGPGDPHRRGTHDCQGRHPHSQARTQAKRQNMTTKTLSPNCCSGWTPTGAPPTICRSARSICTTIRC